MGVRMCGIAQRIASPLPRPPSASTRRAAAAGDLSGAVGRVSDDDDDLAGVALAAPHDLLDARRFLLGGDDRGDVGSRRDARASCRDAPACRRR